MNHDVCFSTFIKFILDCCAGYTHIHPLILQCKNNPGLFLVFTNLKKSSIMKEMINLIKTHTALESLDTEADRRFRWNYIAIIMMVTMLLEWAC